MTIEDASRMLPTVSPKLYREWESGSKLPLDAVQTFVIWKLNTSSKPRPIKRRENARGFTLTSGLPVATFAATAFTSLLYHFSQPPHPPALAGYIVRSAPNRFLEKASAKDYQGYADQLQATLITHFDAREREEIFGEHTSIAEQLLSE